MRKNVDPRAVGRLCLRALDGDDRGAPDDELLGREPEAPVTRLTEEHAAPRLRARLERRGDRAGLADDDLVTTAARWPVLERLESRTHDLRYR